MATNVTLKRKTASGTDELHPSTSWGQIDATTIPDDFNPSSHSHGNITNGGAITANATIASGDHLVIADNSASNALTTSSITFGTSTTQFLRNNGTWGTVSGTDSSKLPLTGGTLTGDLTMASDGESTANDSHGINFTGRFLSTPFVNKLYMDSSANLKFGTNTIFHSGNDGSSSGLHADLLDGQQGSYYLNYNNFTNTPTIPTDTNNYLTGVSGSGDGTVTFTRQGLGNLTWDASHSHSEYLPLSGGTMTGELIIDNSTANRIRLYTEQGTSQIADTFTDTSTFKSYIYFDQGTSSNDPGFIMHETSDRSSSPDERNEGVLHLVPSDDNSYGDYVSIHGTNDPDKLKLHTDGTIEGVKDISLSGNITVGGTVDGVDIAALNTTVSGKANTASPAFTGNPTAPTPTAGDDDTSIATTAFVTTAIENLVNGASASFDTLKEIQDAMATDTELSNAIAGLTIGNGTQTISVGTGLDGGGSFTANQTGNSTVSISLDLSEFTDMTADVNGLADELILLDAGAERRKLISEIKLSQFNNDSGWTSNSGDITGVTAGSGLTGGSTSGNATLNVGAGLGISVAADTVRIANAYSPNTATELGSSQNLNDITTAGFYYQTANADTSGNNYPSGEAGSLLVQRSAGLVTQTYTTYSSSPKVFVRTYYTSWGSWQRVFLDNYHPNADKLTTARTITLGGDLTGNVSFDGSANVTLTAAVSDDSHNHTIANVDGLQSALDGKASSGHTHSNLVSVSGDTMTGDLTMQKDGTTNVGSHGVVFQANTSLGSVGDFTKELNIDSAGNLQFDGNTIFHAGNDGSASGLHADLLDGQQGSYYLNYNNLSNTPTLITNNNQLTNGAGYVTANTQLSNEQVQDIVGAMVSSNSESGISVTYQDTDGTLDFNVNDPTITLTGDVTGSATMTNLGNVSITTTVGNDSHTHDGRYYTESEVDTLLAGKASSSHNHSASEIVTGNFNTARLGSGTATSGYVLKSDGDGTASWQQDNNTTYSLGSFGVTATAAELNKMDGVTATTTELNYTDGVTSNIQTQLNSKLSTSAAAAAVTYTTSCPTANNSTGMKVYVGSTDCSTKYTGWLYIVT